MSLDEKKKDVRETLKWLPYDLESLIGAYEEKIFNLESRVRELEVIKCIECGKSLKDDPEAFSFCSEECQFKNSDRIRLTAEAVS